MSIPVADFVTTHHTEANRLLHVLVNVANGFYYRKNFAVLPYLIEGNAAVTYLPDLPYHNIQDGWSKWVQTNELDIPLSYPTDWVEEIRQLFDDQTPLLAARQAELSKQWHQTFPNVWAYLCNIFPSLQTQVTHIEIRVTAYGTKMSYQSLQEKPSQTWTCYIRQDMPISVVYEGLVQGILHHPSYRKMMTWEGRETIADFIINQLQSIGYIQDFKPTINALLTIDPSLIAQSHQYLQQLGMHFTKPFTIKESTIYYQGKPITQLLTTTQNILLLKLIHKDECCTTYDELGSVLWEKEEHFSIWAINKSMSRLKEKLIELNIPVKIENKKGEGYFLHTN